MNKRNYLTTFVAEGVVIASYLLSFRLVAAFDGTQGFGEYSLSRRTLSLLMPLAVLGIDMAVARYVAYAEADNSGRSPRLAVASVMLVCAGTGLVSGVLVAAPSFWSGIFFGSRAYSDLVLALPPLLAGAGLHVVAFGYLRGLNRIQEANLLMLVDLGLLPLAAILAFHGSVLAILDAMGIGMTLIAGLFLVRLPLRIGDVRDSFRELLRFGVPRVPGDFVALLMFAMPGILVAHSADIRVAGIVAFGIAAVSMIGSSLTPVSFVLLPVASRLLAAGRVGQLRSEVIDVVGITLAGTLVLVVLLEVFAGVIVNAYLGPAFRGGVDVLRLTLIGALPWAAYITLRSVIDARHVKPINARNLVFSFLIGAALAFGFQKVADPTTAAVLAFVLSLWLLAGLTLLEAQRVANIFGGARRPQSPTVVIRLAMLALLPVAILVSSPQRPWLALAITSAYVVLALFAGRPKRSDAITLAFVGAIAVWMTISWLRTMFWLHLDATQLSYGASKYSYFVFIVLPLAAAVAMLIGRAEDIWPVAGSQLALGAVVALVTVALLGDKILGSARYTWQGDLIALGTLIAVQPWLVKKIWASAAIGVLGVAGIMFAGARQSLLAFAVALILSAIYWAASRYVRETRGRPHAFRLAAAGPYVVLPLALLALTGAAIAYTYHWTPSTCDCVTDRIISLEKSPGDRDLLLYHGLELLAQQPVLGTGLGSFAGAVPISGGVSTGFYQYPHNVPLEVASETGLIGFLLVFGPMVAGWIAFLRAGIRRASPAAAGLMMIVAVFFTTANFSGDIPSNRGLWVFGVLAFKLGVDALRLRVAAPVSVVERRSGRREVA